MSSTAVWTTITGADGSKLTVPVSAGSAANQEGFIKPMQKSTGTACDIVAQQKTAQHNTAQQHHATVHQ